MNPTTYPNGITVFDVEPDPQAADKLKDLMAAFSANAVTAPSNGGLLVATVNNTHPDAGMRSAMLERFKDVAVFNPLGEQELKKIFHVTTGRLLDQKSLTPRQRGAAENFIAESTPDFEPGQGARGIAKHVTGLLGGSAFTALMEEYSPGGTQRSFENAIMTGAKKAGPAPATARFKPRRKP